MIITIDGPAASGKGTVAHIIAQKLSMYYLNSGILYRALAYALHNTFARNIDQLQSRIKTMSQKDLKTYTEHIRYTYKNNRVTVFYKNRNITSQLHTPECAHSTSIISSYPNVREVVNNLQHTFASHDDVIVDGRDSGSVVFAHADIKFFLTADITVRAQRFLHDPKRRTQKLTMQKAQVLLEERDKRDSNRDSAPLIVPKNAVSIDNSEMSIDETVEKILDEIKALL